MLQTNPTRACHICLCKIDNVLLLYNVVFGYRKTFGFSMLFASLLTLVFPMAAKMSVYMALVARIMLGIFHAVAFPAMTGSWGAWAPPLEKTQ